MPEKPDATQAINDFAWALTSPSLIAPLPGAGLVDGLADARVRSLIDRLQQDPIPLLEHLANRETRFLGSYFEALWEFWLMQDGSIEIVERRKQIHDAGKTLGEFDFLLQDRAHQHYIHQELAVKLYLGVPTPQTPAETTEFRSGPHHWIGPNANDRLDLKLAKLTDQQLRFAEHPQAKAWLDRRGLRPLSVEVVMKGYLFYPFNTCMLPPGTASANHLRGSWLYWREAEQLPKSARRWTILEKNRWLSPAFSVEEQTYELQNLLEQLESISRPIMVAAMQTNGNLWRETQRFFIVPTDWPNSKRPG